jgi:DNA-binding MarR family transcriptional regulator
MERASTRFGEHRRRRRTWQPILEAQWLCGYWLKRADRRVSNSFAGYLKGSGLIASEWAALREMYGPGRTSSISLASAIGMTKGGASKLIDRLVRKGFASRKVGEFDRRCRPVRLTRRGRTLVPYLAMLEEVTDGDFFPKEKLRYNLMRALKRVVHAGRNERVNVWQWPRSKHFSMERACYSSGAAPRPSAVASSASNSSDDSSRNRPRDK